MYEKLKIEKPIPNSNSLSGHFLINKSAQGNEPSFFIKGKKIVHFEDRIIQSNSTG